MCVQLALDSAFSLTFEETPHYLSCVRPTGLLICVILGVTATTRAQSQLHHCYLTVEAVHLAEELTGRNLETQVDKPASTHDKLVFPKFKAADQV